MAIVRIPEQGRTLKTKEARVWEITAECADGRPASKEFMSWTAAQEAFHGRIIATVRSYIPFDWWS